MASHSPAKRDGPTDKRGHSRMTEMQMFGLVNTFVSTLSGGGIALGVVYLTNRFDKEKRRKEILLGRGEELYALVKKWQGGLFAYYLHRSYVMQGKLTYDQIHELEIAEAKSGGNDFSRIEMLIDVYFPSTRPAYDRVTTARDTLSHVASTYKREYEAGDIDGDKFCKPFLQAMQDVEKAAKPLLEAIITDLLSL